MLEVLEILPFGDKVCSDGLEGRDKVCPDGLEGRA